MSCPWASTRSASSAEDVDGRPTIAIRCHPGAAALLYEWLADSGPLDDWPTHLTPECKHLINTASAEFCRQWDEATRDLDVQPCLPVGVRSDLACATRLGFDQAITDLLKGDSFCLGELHGELALDLLTEKIESLRGRTVCIEHLSNELQPILDDFLAKEGDAPIPSSSGWPPER